MFDGIISFAAIDWPKSIAASLVLSAIATLINWVLHAANSAGAVAEASAQRDRQARKERDLKAKFERTLKDVLVRLAASDGDGEESKTETITQICQGLCETGVTIEEIRHKIRHAKSKLPSVKECVREITPSLNDNGKGVLMQAAFVVTVSGGSIADREKSLLVELGLALKIDRRLLPALSAIASRIAEGSGLSHGCFDEVLDQIQTGCPHCGFAYGWNGDGCVHCQYERPSGTTDEEWGRVAERVQRVGEKRLPGGKHKRTGG